MGCDIHLHVEIKVKGKWMHYNHPQIDRDYILFAKMVGVRNSSKIEPISRARGLPTDITKSTRYDYELWPEDYHHMSWLSAEEVDVLENWYNAEGTTVHGFNGEFGYLMGNSFGGFLRYPEERAEGLEDFRFVFWFDN